MSWFDALFAWLNALPYPLLTLFLSAFLSATLLPGNSELALLALSEAAIRAQSSLPWGTLLRFWLVATIGNTLGGLSTFYFARLLPYSPPQTRWTQRAQRLYQRVGLASLLLSGLPLIGDLLCALAGWQRAKSCAAGVILFIGKGARYLLLLLPILWLN